MARILVVDDEPQISRLVEANLRRQGHEVETAVNGLEALRMLLSDRPDLLILDIVMPEMNGLELLAHMRSDPDLAELPVIMLTNKATDNDVMTGFARGADLYLTKPFHPEELIAFVQRILEQDAAESGDTRLLA